MTLEILQVGWPVLRQRARPLAADEIRSTAIRRLIEEMRETMREAPGVGLAAPQIGQKRVVPPLTAPPSVLRPTPGPPGATPPRWHPAWPVRRPRSAAAPAALTTLPYVALRGKV